MNNLFDRLLLHAIRRRLARPGFDAEIYVLLLDQAARDKVDRVAERMVKADTAIRTLARRVEIRRIITDYAEQTTTPLPIQ